MQDESTPNFKKLQLEQVIQEKRFETKQMDKMYSGQLFLFCNILETNINIVCLVNHMLYKLGNQLYV